MTHTDHETTLPPDPEKVHPGGEELYWEAFEDYARTLLAWIRLRIPLDLRGHLDPEDLFQEIAVRACLGLGRLRESEGFRPWILGIARNVLREHLRHLGRRGHPAAPQRLRTSLACDFPDRVTSLTRRIARGEEAERALAELDRLAEEDRRLLIYHGIEELPLIEAAELVGLGYEAARKRWQRLRGRLRTLL